VPNGSVEKDFVELDAGGQRSHTTAGDLAQPVVARFATRRVVFARMILLLWWHRVRDGTMKRETFRRKLEGSEGLKAKVRALLERGEHCWHPKTARTCAKMLQVFPAFWTFAEHSGIEPTNNEAERRIRPGVMYRRVSLGTVLARARRRSRRALVQHLLRLPPRTLVLIFGDHGFAFDPLDGGTSCGRQGGALPEEVLVPAFAWLVGNVH
jgi:transposase IS66 family protein